MDVRDMLKPGDQLLTRPTWSNVNTRRWVTITENMGVRVEADVSWMENPTEEQKKGSSFSWNFFFDVNIIIRDENGNPQIKELSDE